MYILRTQSYVSTVDISKMLENARLFCGCAAAFLFSITTQKTAS